MTGKRGRMPQRPYLVVVAVLACISFNCACSLAEQGAFIGEPPSLFQTEFHSGGAASADTEVERIVIWDRTVRQVIVLDLTGGSILGQYRAPESFEPQGIINADAFVIAFDNRKLLTFAPSGQVDEVDLGLFGEIKGQLYSQERQTLALQDSFRHLALVTMNQDGTVAQVWSGGPLIAERSVLTAGAMIGDGRIVAFDSGGSFIVLDVAATMAGGTYVFEEFKVDAVKEVKWMAAGRGGSEVLIQTGDKVLLFHLDQRQVLSSFELEASPQVDFGIVGKQWQAEEMKLAKRAQALRSALPTNSTLATPHVLIRSRQHAQLYHLYYADDEGGLKERAIVLPEGHQVNQSVFDGQSDVLFLVLEFLAPGQRGSYEVMRLRGVDSRILSQDVIKIPYAIMTPNYVVQQHQSVLGKIEFKAYGAEHQWQSLVGFNLDYLVRRD